ncbi:hypothetical protein C0993_001698 [Termitomyces sp. T159_Od127]|nr:hypothetical protein C0993_001698 [Termitomyces sp. T159_Od127]
MTESKEVVSDDVQALSDLGEFLITSIIADEPIQVIKTIIERGAPLWYQDAAEGMSALHAAAYMQNAELVKTLIDHGAIWNAVDNLQQTAGDISLSFNDVDSYTIIRDAGIRSELLLSLLSKSSLDTTLVLKETDTSAIGDNDAFLSSKLVYVNDENGQDVCLLRVGDEEVGVMMGWERNIMKRTVQALCADHPNAHKLKILNVGFGLGISLETQPSQHVIIEPHPDVLRFMKERGWYEKPGVTILEGKWQDYLESESLLGVGGFDVVYTDTFSEDYGDLHRFFEALPDLLAGPDSRFSFFNGLGATNALFYDVYTHIAELHLSEVGIDVQWFDVDVSYDASKENRWGNSRNYFSLPLYLEGGILPAVSQTVAPPVSKNVSSINTPGFVSPRDTLLSGTGVVVAVNDTLSQLPATPLLQAPVLHKTTTSTGLAFDEEAKLVYGVILSLRNMIKKLSGRDEQFVNFKTSSYKLHLYETISGYKFVMLSDPNTDSLRFILRQIYSGPFLEYVVRNPLVKMDSRDFGVDNEYFRASVDRLVRGLAVFS